MAEYKQIVMAAQVSLESHEIFQDETVKRAWQTITWKGQNVVRGDTTARLDLSGKPIIYLYPAIKSSDRSVEEVLREFGLYMYRRGEERSQAIWEKKLCVPDDDQIRKFDDALKSASNRKSCHTYSELVHTYPTKGGSVDRLVAINLANALLVNNIPYPDSTGVDVYTWGPTSEYANQKKYHSLIPLASAYAPVNVTRCFGCAFASWVTYNMNTVLDKSVAFGLKTVMRNVIKRAQTD